MYNLCKYCMYVLFTLWIDLNVNENRRQVIKSEIGHAYNASLNNYLVQHLNVSCICRGGFKFFVKHKPIQMIVLTKLIKGVKRERKQREQLVTLEKFSM